MGLQSEVAGLKEADICIRYLALESRSPAGTRYGSFFPRTARSGGCRVPRPARADTRCLSEPPLHNLSANPGEVRRQLCHYVKGKAAHALPFHRLGGQLARRVVWEASPKAPARLPVEVVASYSQRMILQGKTRARGIGLGPNRVFARLPVPPSCRRGRASIGQTASHAWLERLCWHLHNPDPAPPAECTRRQMQMNAIRAGRT
jgi:hypothetical protein